MATAQEVQKLVNGVKVNDLMTTVEAIKAAPAIAKFKFRISNEWSGASHNCSTVDSYFGAGQEHRRQKPFKLQSDEPEVLLGTDGAANPVEYLLHALAACLTTSMVYHAAARGIEIEEVESSFEGDIDLHGFLELDKNVRQGFQAIRVNFKVRANVPDQQIEEIVALGTSHSPVFDSLTKGVPVSVNAQRM